MKKLIIAVIVLLSCATIYPAQTNSNKKQNDVCYRWQTQVDPSLERIIFDKSILTDEEIIEGIGCLLQLKDRNKTARFTGNTRTNLNSSDQYRPPKHPATVASAALYYASYLFYENWEHAGSVSLYDADAEKSNTKLITKRAYRSYSNWFEKVKKLGLKKAREQKLDPLENSGVAWS